MERLREFKYSIETIECIFTSWGIRTIAVSVYMVLFLSKDVQEWGKGLEEVINPNKNHKK